MSSLPSSLARLLKLVTKKTVTGQPRKMVEVVPKLPRESFIDALNVHS
jgi:hypothetical protein